MAIGKTCESCTHAEELDEHHMVTCTCVDSDNFEKEMPAASWCGFYEEG
jgi:hypothetical protein